MNADTEGSITIIGISNNGVVEEQMSPKVTSRFGREHIKFSKYNAIQLRKILERRKDNAFQSGAVADGVIANRRCHGKRRRGCPGGDRSIAGHRRTR